MLGLAAPSEAKNVIMQIQSVECSGFSMSNGALSIHYAGDQIFNLTSIIYFNTIQDTAAIVSSSMNDNHDITFELHTQTYNSMVRLTLFNGSTRGELATTSGTDELTCHSRISN